MKVAASILFSLLLGHAYAAEPVAVSIDVGVKPIHKAAENGDLQQVINQLDRGTPVDTRTERSNATPLHFAARDGQYDIVKLLLDRGADVNARTAYNETPLHYAASSHLLKCANPMRHGDMQGLSESHFAVARLLLLKGADADPKNGDGTTPLEYAAQCNDVKIAKLLIENGADINHRGHQYSVLDMALHWGPDVAKQLIENGVKVNTVTPYSGETPLYSAVSRGRVEVARMLLEHGAEVNARTQREGEIALHAAYARCDSAMVKLLLEFGADSKAKDFKGEIPAQMSAFCH